MRTRTFHQDGSMCLRDGTYKDREGFEIDNRFGEFAHSIDEIDDRGHKTRSTGDILGQVFFEREDGERPIGSWFFACPARTVSSNEIRPIANKDYEADERYPAVQYTTPPEIGEIPNGTVGVALTATKEDGDQEVLFFPSMGGGTTLIASNRNDFPELGTDVFDINEDGEPDPGKVAKLQSHLRVMNFVIEPDDGSPPPSSFGALGKNGIFGKALVQGMEIDGPFGLGGLGIGDQIPRNADGSIQVGIVGANNDGLGALGGIIQNNNGTIQTGIVGSGNNDLVGPLGGLVTNNQGEIIAGIIGT